MSNVPLKEYLEMRIIAQEKALTLARETLETRLAGMNEFREQLKDQASRFITRTELEANIAKIEADIKILNKFKDIAEGKASATSVYVAYVIAAIGIIIGVIGLFV